MMAGKAPVVFLSSSSSVKGKITHIENSDKPVYTYLGIPFAEPPVGELRLKKPVTKKLWEGERDASDHGPSPIQDLAAMNAYLEKVGHMKLLAEMDEDCLHLNVYTPTKSSSESLPVMVWFFGGGFICGGTTGYSGTSLASLHDVILVAINYRLGILGFFSTGDETCPGNFAFWDMIEGLKWVQKHISKFGGDPKNVTAFGESAGGWACHYLNLTAESRGLFHRMITISGVAGMNPPLLTADKSQDNCSTVAKVLEMPDGSSPADVHAAIMTMTPEDLVKMIPLGLTFKPTLDGQLFTRHYKDILIDGDFAKVNAIYMMTSHEGHYMYKLALKPMCLPLKTKQDFVGFMKAVINMIQGILGLMPKDADRLAEVLAEEYCPVDPSSEDEMEAGVIEVTTDFMFSAGIDKCAGIHADYVPNGTYYAIYGYRHSLAETLAGAMADHGDDIPMDFGFPFFTREDRCNQDYSEADKKMSKILMEYFCNFAKSGNPNGGEVPTWPNYTTKKPQYLYMDSDTKPVDKAYKPGRMRLWDTIREKHMENMF